MGEAYDDYLRKRDAYQRAVHTLDAAVQRLRAYPRPLIEDCNCNVPLPGMSMRTYISASRRALEGSNTARRRQIAELMKHTYVAQREVARAWEQLSEQERSKLAPSVHPD